MESYSPSSYMRVIRLLFRQLRDIRGLSQGQVKARSGVDISKFEAGFCNLSCDSIHKLCIFYELRLAGFFLVCDELTMGRMTQKCAIKALEEWFNHDHLFQIIAEAINAKSQPK